MRSPNAPYWIAAIIGIALLCVLIKVTTPL